MKRNPLGMNAVFRYSFRDVWELVKLSGHQVARLIRRVVGGIRKEIEKVM